MTELLFYHLTRRRLEQVLPELLEKTLQRGWRAVVKGGTPERIDDLNNVLWT
jgi:DNA polymerase-3 subunit chi